MPEYLSPGVYIEEVNNGPRPIESVGTAMAAFVGFAPAGPANKPRLITNWTQYVETFGAVEDGGARNPHMSGAFLSHAVYGYFLNGGSRCYVTRIVPASSNGAGPKAEPTQLPSRSSKAVPSLSFTPKGDTSADIQVEVLPPSGEAPPDGSFTLKIRQGDIEETYENVNLGKKGSPVVEKVNSASRLVAVAELGTGSIIDRAPELGNFIVKAAPPPEAPKVSAPVFVGSPVDRSGVEGLEIADDVTMVCAPDLMSAYLSGSIDRDGVKAVQLAMIAHCERMADRVAILDPLPELGPQEVKKWREVEAGYDSMFATLYYPWINVMGPDGKPLAVPPSGHMAGVWARSDNERGVHKAPANEVVRGALDPVYQITKGEQDTLNPNGVNCIRTFVGRGVRVWGARTLSSDPAWRYINVRRLFNMVEKSIERATQWVVFEPNDQNLWARVRRDVGAYLTVVWRDGMLFGTSPNEAFYVKCDAELNPPESRDLGRLVIEVGLAPVKPAEFVIFRFSQFSGGGA